MKELVELLKRKGLLLKELKPVDLKSLGIKKRVEAFEGVDISNRYVLILHIKRKSRFLRKDAEDLLQIKDLIQRSLNHGFKRFIAVVEAPFCSKAKEYLQKEGWSFYAR